jgi:hypothetical protein
LAAGVVVAAGPSGLCTPAWGSWVPPICL